MPAQQKYLVTVDSATRKIVKVQELGEAGELTEVSPSVLESAPSRPARTNYTVNIYMGSETVDIRGSAEDDTFVLSEDIPSGTNLSHRIAASAERRKKDDRKKDK